MSQRTSLDAIEGRIQTLSSRGALRFNLFDSLNNKAVACYVSEDQHDLLRDLWDRRAIVEGLVNRNPITGQPTSIREITEIRLLEEPSEGYRAAKGAIPFDPSTPLPEVLIRQMRDAW